ncbi:MAG: acetolactate decarboxylase [Candidatus Margulisbacteria bacterium]|nr:acetolactate decarboxylase [Candidatus Margulisiibacteriota bacterium]
MRIIAYIIGAIVIGVAIAGITLYGLMLSGSLPAPSSNNNETLFQLASYQAFSQGEFDGQTTINNLSQYGDFGFGAADSLDGEIILVDGTFYQVKLDGSAYSVASDQKSPFMMMTFFQPDQFIVTDEAMDLHHLKKYLDNAVQNKKNFQAIRIDGLFKYIKTLNFAKQGKPYSPLAKILKDQTSLEFHNIKGTILGFRVPNGLNNVSPSGYNFYFITKDRKAGGRLVNCSLEDISIAIDQTPEFNLNLAKEAVAEDGKKQNSL